MLDLNTAQEYWISAEPTDMRKGCDSLASVVREKFGKDPKMGSRSQLLLLLTGTVQKDLRIN